MTEQNSIYTIIFTLQNNTTVEKDITASNDLDASRIAQTLLAENDYKSWEFADGQPTMIGTL